MTVRAFVIGVCLGLFVCAFTYLNDRVIQQTFFVGSSIPVGVFGVLLLLCMVSPLLARLRKRWAFTGPEMAVILALSLAPCCIPSAGMLESFPELMMMPHHMKITRPAWQKHKIVERVPNFMLADPSGQEDRAVGGFVSGLAIGEREISADEVPWSAWAKPLAFWIPCLLALWFALIGLTVVLHRRWSRQEQLPYPISTFIASVMPSSDGTPGKLFRHRLFWWGCGIVLTFHFANYLFLWWPDTFFSLPRRVDMFQLVDLFPTLHAGGGWDIFRPTVYFAVVGLAFLLPLDVSFSLGIGPLAFMYISGTLLRWGFSVGASQADVPVFRTGLQAGAWIAYLLAIVYAGRHYYKHVALKTVGLTSSESIEPVVVWGARAFVVFSAILTIMLSLTGLHPVMALLYVTLTVSTFAVVARLTAETGFIFIQQGWAPTAVILGAVGSAAIGPTTILIMFIINSVLLFDIREALSGYLATAYQVVDRWRLSLRTMALATACVLVAGVAIAVPVTLYQIYDRGTDKRYTIGTLVSEGSYDAALAVEQRLEAQGTLQTAEAGSLAERLRLVKPDGPTMIGLGVGVILVALLSGLRFRLPWWPLHPVMFLVWANFTGYRYSATLLLAFVIKAAVLKYGGDKTYRRVKPFMLGLIAADVLAAIITSIIGAVYFSATGHPPPRFVIMTG